MDKNLSIFINLNKSIINLYPRIITLYQSTIDFSGHTSNNWIKFKVILVETCRFIIDTGFKLDLYDVFCVPSVSKNLVSLAKLDLEDFSFIFVNSNFRLMKNFILVGTGTHYKKKDFSQW